MRYAIIVQELPNGETFLYTNLKSAALDPMNPLDVEYKMLIKSRNDKREEQEKSGVLATGYPFIVDMCKINRIPIVHKVSFDFAGASNVKVHDAKKIMEWAGKIGITESAMKARIRKHGLEKAINMKKGNPKHYKGKTLKEWAVELKLSDAALYHRIKKHGLKKAINMKKGNPKHYKGKTLKEWAVELKLSDAALYYRIRKHGWEKAIKKPVRRKSKQKDI